MSLLSKSLYETGFKNELHTEALTNLTIHYISKLLVHDCELIASFIAFNYTCLMEWVQDSGYKVTKS